MRTPPVRTSRKRALATAILVSASGCSEWPRWQYPEPDPDGWVDGQTDPRSLVVPRWVGTGDDLDNDQPVGITRHQLAPGWGLSISGRLEGLGWSDQLVPQQLDGEACGSTGVRTPDELGDYAADVDVYAITPLADATLCARALMSNGDAGYDLLAMEVDDCGVPVAFAYDLETEEPIGKDISDAVIDWAATVEAGKTYAVLLGGFWPDAPDTLVPYDLGLTLVPTTDSSLGTLCPYLAEETKG